MLISRSGYNWNNVLSPNLWACNRELKSGRDYNQDSKSYYPVRKKEQANVSV